MTKQFLYVQCDVPEGVTLQNYRRTIETDRPKRRFRPWHDLRIKARKATAWMHW